MPKVTEQHMEARRQQIIEAALTCFARNGFHQTTMQDVCKEAGLSAGAVYNYFTSKEEIINQCCLGSQSEIAQAFASIDHSGGTFAAMNQVIDRFFGELSSSEADTFMRFHVQIWGESLRNPEVKEGMHIVRQQVLTDLAEVVRRGQASGELTDGADPKNLAMVLMSVYEGLILQKALDPSIDVGSYVSAFRSIISGYLVGAAQIEW